MTVALFYSFVKSFSVTKLSNDMLEKVVSMR